MKKKEKYVCPKCGYDLELRVPFISGKDAWYSCSNPDCIYIKNMKVPSRGKTLSVWDRIAVGFDTSIELSLFFESLGYETMIFYVQPARGDMHYPDLWCIDLNRNRIPRQDYLIEVKLIRANAISVIPRYQIKKMFEFANKHIIYMTNEKFRNPDIYVAVKFAIKESERWVLKKINKVPKNDFEVGVLDKTDMEVVIDKSLVEEYVSNVKLLVIIRRKLEDLELSLINTPSDREIEIPEDIWEYRDYPYHPRCKEPFRTWFLLEKSLSRKEKMIEKKLDQIIQKNKEFIERHAL